MAARGTAEAFGTYTLSQVQNTAGSNYKGIPTGDNSGIYPDKVITNLLTGNASTFGITLTVPASGKYRVSIYLNTQVVNYSRDSSLYTQFKAVTSEGEFKFPIPTSADYWLNNYTNTISVEVIVGEDLIITLSGEETEAATGYPTIMTQIIDIEEL